MFFPGKLVTNGNIFIFLKEIWIIPKICIICIKNFHWQFYDHKLFEW